MALQMPTKFREFTNFWQLAYLSSCRGQSRCFHGLLLDWCSLQLIPPPVVPFNSIQNQIISLWKNSNINIKESEQKGPLSRSTLKSKEVYSGQRPILPPSLKSVISYFWPSYCANTCSLLATHAPICVPSQNSPGTSTHWIISLQSFCFVSIHTQKFQKKCTLSKPVSLHWLLLKLSHFLNFTSN